MKIFAVSDLHSFFNETQEALSAAGFNPEDENHLLVVCGDGFVYDRMSGYIGCNFYLRY